MEDSSSEFCVNSDLLGQEQKRYKLSVCKCAFYITTVSQGRTQGDRCLGAYPRGPLSRGVPKGYRGIYTPKLSRIVHQRDIFVPDIIGCDRLKLYLKIYTHKMKSWVRHSVSTDVVQVQTLSPSPPPLYHRLNGRFQDVSYFANSLLPPRVLEESLWGKWQRFPVTQPTVSERESKLWPQPPR